MKELIKKVNELKKDPISKVISERMNDFINIRFNEDMVFSELCFCLMTANYQAEKSIYLQKLLEKDFFSASEEKLARKLKKEGHRFWPQRAKRIVMSREVFPELYFMMADNPFSEHDIRNWIVKNVHGIGMKEASHFLRNIGFNDVAIIDFHIVDLLVDQNLIEKPKTITPKIYLEIESVLRILGGKVDMGLGELDLYLWYLETGKVLK